MIKVGIVGGTGYTGAELLRILARHPGAAVTVITSRGEAGTAVSDLFPHLRGRVDLRFSEPDRLRSRPATACSSPRLMERPCSRPRNSWLRGCG